MASPTELRLGTRGSQLALWQANDVARRLTAVSGRPCRLTIIKTSGDRLQEAPLSEAGGKRLFVKEIEDALLRGDIDLAVHSCKDMPVVLPEGLAIAAALPREDPLDAMVLPVMAKGSEPTAEANDHPSMAISHQPSAVTSLEDLVAQLGQEPRIGTSSVRRVAQLTRLFPSGRFVPMRGNLDTRLRKLDRDDYDAIVLAAAGLRRLGFASRISFALPASACVPAPGQGIVAVEIRGDDERTRAEVAAIDDAAASVALSAERAMVAALGGGCQTPIGALTTAIDADTIEIVGLVVAIDGSRAIRKHQRGSPADAAALGAAVAGQLLADGAAEILADADGRQLPVVDRQS